MNNHHDTALQQSASGFSFTAFIAFVFQLHLRDTLSAANRDDGAITWGM